MLLCFEGCFECCFEVVLNVVLRCISLNVVHECGFEVV